LILTAAAMAVASTSAMQQRPTSTPTIMSTAPQSPAAGPKAQTLTVNGKDFMPGLSLAIHDPAGGTVVLRDKSILQQQSTSFQVSAVLATSGNYSLVVTNPDGGTSQAFVVTAKTGDADEPVIERVSPGDLAKRQDQQLLHVEGQRFASGLTAMIGDPIGNDVQEVSVARVTPTSFDLTVKLEYAGEYTITLKNPSGAVSKAFLVTVR
jgi:hypothetical protein